MDIAAFQQAIEATYGDRDRKRGEAAAFLWFVEEVGELAEALRRGSDAERLGEFGDVLAWLVTLASLHGVDMSLAAARFAEGCPKCGGRPCVC
ncbi:MAG: MazG nucleotide pyrophosphohydrolase domain-containing protein [Ardenticatenales bacterium]